MLLNNGSLKGPIVRPLYSLAPYIYKSDVDPSKSLEIFKTIGLGKCFKNQSHKMSLKRTTIKLIQGLKHFH